MAAGEVKAPLSLLDLFDPPEGYLGKFGWMCGYSADAAFLDSAAGRFTGQSQSRRAREGTIALAVMLDPQNRQIPLFDAPGVLHLPIRHVNSRPFNLLHAKIAILGFRNETDDGIVRLIVSTGNWTQQTLEDSLDLHWRVELNIKALRDAPQSGIPHVDCADVLAAWQFLAWTRRFVDASIVVARQSGMPRSATLEAVRWLIAQMNRIRGAAASSNLRFFDNRHMGLLPQIPALVAKVAGNTRRNWLILGSGFFESAKSQAEGNLPDVIDAIVSTLQSPDSNKNHRLLTASPKLDLFVNPEECQAVAPGSAALIEVGWTIRPPNTPDFFKGGKRRLHAKFMFSANSREKSDSLSSAWVYLGSGNLTARGLTRAAGRDGGNLEAGVVLSVSDVTCHDIAMHLPVQFDEDCSPKTLAPGPEMSPPAPQFFASPVSYFLAEKEAGGICLRAFSITKDNFAVLDTSRKVCARLDGGRFAWPQTMPRTVRVRWREDSSDVESDVPVIDEFGRVGAGAIIFQDIEAVWAELASFPLTPSDEEPDGSAEAAGSEGGSDHDGQPTAFAYPIRALMELVENIAELQTQLSRSNWMSWCSRLEQTLVSLDHRSSAIQECHRIGLNVLSPLRQSAFRPDFATAPNSPEGKRYDAVLQRIMAAWQIERLPEL